MLSVAVLSALSGCDNPFTHKSLFGFHDPTAEHQHDTGPVITAVPVEATYTLKLLDNENSSPLASVRLARGERVGFRRDNDKLVAVAGKQTFEVPDGTVGWVISEQKHDPMKHLMDQTRETLENFKQSVLPVATVVVAVCIVAGAIVAVVVCRGDLSGMNFGSGS
jgi:hypothetical protein